MLATYTLTTPLNVANNSTYTVIIQFLQADGVSPFDFSTWAVWTLSCQIRRFARSPIVLASPTVTFDGAASTGRLQIQITKAQAELIKYQTSVFDVIFSNAGVYERPLAGSVQLTFGVTR